MPNVQPLRLKTIAEFHQFRGLPKPAHPLISVINVETLNNKPGEEFALIKDFYSIGLKRNINYKVKYGQQSVDFDEGMMFFMSPGQLLQLEFEKDSVINQTGWMLLIHPDFLWNTPLAKKIKQYEFFNYAVHEALFVSEKEDAMVSSIMLHMEKEYLANLDAFTQDIIIMQLELIFTYAERFYHRQFLSRKKTSHAVLDRMEDVLSRYFNGDRIATRGVPTVSYVADELNISANYLGSMLKVLTGQNAQQHIHNKLIELAKEKLSGTELSVSEIAFGLGFEHSQSFSKLFKTKTNLSPIKFRETFN